MAEWIDLTRPLDDSTAIYRAEGYSDPAFRAEQWASHADAGFDVCALSLGTQTGAHIDAPSHMEPGGANIDSLRPEECVGSYRLVRADALESCAEQDWSGVAALLLDARCGDSISVNGVLALTRSAPRLVVLVGDEVSVSHPDPLHFHRAIAASDRFLIEDTKSDVGALPYKGCIVALPLRLIGLSGSPVRVLVRAER